MFPEQPFGFVAGRWVLSIGDTTDDPDRAPDYVPVPKGKVIFRPVLSHRVLPDTDPGAWAGVINRDVNGTLGDRGQLVDAGGHDYLALALGRYRVSFEFESASWPSFEIDVTEEHTVDAPLWLPTMSPLPTGPGVVQVVTEETRIAAEAAAARAEVAAAAAESAMHTVGGAAVRFSVDGARPELGVITFPAFALSPDAMSVVVPIEGVTP